MSESILKGAVRNNPTIDKINHISEEEIRALAKVKFAELTLGEGGGSDDHNV
ncbi:MAG: hypothetical protein LBV33_08515 [Lachnospiraceae bacterium]|jgi:hypothetical protein|nr:hypothetical protein [Lachnospiraceae bacterium]